MSNFKNYLMNTASYSPTEIEDGEKQPVLDFCIENAKDADDFLEYLNANNVHFEDVYIQIGEQDQEGCEFPNVGYPDHIHTICHDGETYVVFDKLEGKYDTLESANSRARRLMMGYMALGHGVYQGKDRFGAANYYICVSDKATQVISEYARMTLRPAGESYVVDNGMLLPHQVTLEVQGEWSDFWDAPEATELQKLPDNHPKAKAWANYNDFHEFMRDEVEAV